VSSSLGMDPVARVFESDTRRRWVCGWGNGLPPKKSFKDAWRPDSARFARV
jgi:hypothetical protein